MAAAAPWHKTGEAGERGRVRLGVLAACFAVAFASLGIRLLDMVLTPPEKTASRLAIAADAPDPRRADILDRHGELLATNIVTLSVTADPARLGDHEATARALARVLDGVDAATLMRRFARGGRFAWVKRQISPREQAAVQELGLPGVAFRSAERRVYPKADLTSHVVGYVDIDNQGLAGIEYAMQDQLVGGAEAGKAPLRLSLDLRVQEAAHASLEAAFERFQPVGACAMVMDIERRELLAMASLPDFDPNRRRLAPPEARRNRCSGQVYELGSMFKVITAAMALESGEVSIYDRFDASEPVKIGRNRIRDYHGMKRSLSVPEVFAFSSNIGTVKMAFTAGGADRQRAFLKRLGLFERPGIELPEAARPLLPEKWIDIVSATVAFGHGIAVTPLQFLEAVAAIGGDGRYAGATLLPRDPETPLEAPRVVSDATMRDMRWLMWLAVERGTATKARTSGYLVGGKTGTADKALVGEGRGYRRDAVVSSFAGVFPVEDPRYAVLVLLDEPKGDERTFGFRTGGWNAAPTVGEIVARIGPILGVAPTAPGVEARLRDRLEVRPALNGRTQRMEEGFAAVSLAR